LSTKRYGTTEYRSPARSLVKSGVAPVLLLAVLAACGGGGGGTTFSAHSPTPTPSSISHKQQLKTPSNPPSAVQELASYALPAPETHAYLPGIVWGPDSNVWVSEVDGNDIARITPLGVITTYPLPTASAEPVDMAIGPDQQIWFSETTSDVIAKIDPSNGVITEYPLSKTQFPVIQGEGPRGIIAGPDGNMWFAAPDSSLIGQMTTSGTLLNVYQVPTPASGNTRMAVGPDGNIWFTETHGNNIGRLIPSTGAITEYPVPTPSSYPYGIAPGGDGNVWFTEKDASQVASITPAGFITEYTTPSKIADPAYMAETPDGELWFAEQLANGLCRVDPLQLWFLEYHANNVRLQGIAVAGPSTLWLTDTFFNIKRPAVDEFGPGGARSMRSGDGGPRMPFTPIHKGALVPIGRHEFP
jgi:streptogramin lyase